MPLKEVVCRACQQGNGHWTSSDEERWQDHNLVMCPAVFLAADTTRSDVRTLRNIEEEPPVWCPSIEKHKKAPRKRYIDGE